MNQEELKTQSKRGPTNFEKNGGRKLKAFQAFEKIKGGFDPRQLDSQQIEFLTNGKATSLMEEVMTSHNNIRTAERYIMDNKLAGKWDSFRKPDGILDRSNPEDLDKVKEALQKFNLTHLKGSTDALFYLLWEFQWSGETERTQKAQIVKPPE